MSTSEALWLIGGAGAVAGFVWVVAGGAVLVAGARRWRGGAPGGLSATLAGAAATSSVLLGGWFGWRFYETEAWRVGTPPAYFTVLPAAVLLLGVAHALLVIAVARAWRAVIAAVRAGRGDIGALEEG